MKSEDLLHVVAGTFIILSVTLAHFHHPYWLFFTGFVGLNLFQYGFTRFCPMNTIIKACGLKSVCDHGAKRDGRQVSASTVSSGER